jgi:hypothetical protein
MGESCELSALDFRTPERGVMLPLPLLSLAGASSVVLFARGAVMDVLVKALGVAEEGVAVGPALTATRGAKGDRAVLFEASTGLRGRGLTRSDDMTERQPSDQQHHLVDAGCEGRMVMLCCRVYDTTCM